VSTNTKRIEVISKPLLIFANENFNVTEMKKLEKIVAEKLLKIKAIKVQPSNPFTWASGWKSPIYCDNRKTLSYPEIRTFIKIELARLVREKYEEVDVIAGVATGAIAQGAMVAEELGLPFVYVRSSPKDHGLENLIEGDLKPGQKVVVIEDLISTGGSSLKAVEAIRKDGCEVIGMLAIFSYGFPVAADKFKEANVELTTLSNYESVLEHLLKCELIGEEEMKTLQEWRKDPANWNA
jgi:orotate phosphoribosyltransferase